MYILTQHIPPPPFYCELCMVERSCRKQRCRLGGREFAEAAIFVRPCSKCRPTSSIAVFLQVLFLPGTKCWPWEGDSNSVPLYCRYCSTNSDRHLSISVRISGDDYFYLLNRFRKANQKWPSYEMLPSLSDTR